jgi:3-dehydroquinate synthetase
VVAHALGRHLALVGFMGAGKSSVGARVAERLGRPFVDLDLEVERRTGRSVQEHFAAGEGAFRALEESVCADVLAAGEPAVVALGGGAILSERTRSLLRARAFAVLLEVDADTAWSRVAGSARPLAQDEAEFRALFARRGELYAAVADALARTADEVVLRAGGIVLGELRELELPGTGHVALVSDAHVAGIWGAEAQLALGRRLTSTHELPRGEAAKTLAAVAALWDELRIDRAGTLVALGGGCTTDAVGFAAATYLRGVPWVALPTTLVGQVDAAIGGKTAIDLAGGKNLVGAFHWPERTLIDPALLETLPGEQVREGLAEVVKTGLLAGEPLWELPRPQLVARCAAFKTAVCLRDPYDRGERNQLNLGHTFAHALEAAAGFELPHGRAVALGLLAALRLSGLDTAVVEEQLRPEPVRVDRERAWAALARDKKAEDGGARLVLLDAPGRPRVGVQVPEADVRAALDELIAD